MNLQLFASRKATDARAGKGEPREKFVRRLTHLRLQECGLSEIEHLDATRKLQVLYLNSNRLTVLRGLQHAALCSLIQLDASASSRGVRVPRAIRCRLGVDVRGGRFMVRTIAPSRRSGKHGRTTLAIIRTARSARSGPAGGASGLV